MTDGPRNSDPARPADSDLPHQADHALSPAPSPASPAEREGPEVSAMHGPILREHAEPREGREGMSLWLIGPILLLVFWGGWYLAQHVGAWRGDVLDASPESRLGGVQPAETVNVSTMQLGRQLYGNCLPCHQANGQGMRGLYPPLAGSEWVNGDAQVLSQIVLRGLNGPITVQGSIYNSIMPAWSQRFDDREMAALLTYIRSNFGNSAEEVSPETVGAARRASRGQISAWDESDLHRMRRERDKAAATRAASTQITTIPIPSTQAAATQASSTRPTSTQPAATEPASAGDVHPALGTIQQADPVQSSSVSPAAGDGR